MKPILLFDVDGTLTVPMQSIKNDMIQCLKLLKNKYTLAIVGGSDICKIKKQLGNAINLFDYVFSQNGLEYYKNDILIESTSISKFFGEENLQKIINIVLLCLCDINIPIKRGTFIEYRTGMLNISPIGRNCSQVDRDEFEKYDNKYKIRETLISILQSELSEYDLQFSVGGQISFDIFPKGWDKTYCLKYLKDYDKIYFFGDKCYPGGNDYEIFESNKTTSYSVNNYKETIKFLQELHHV